MRDANSTRRSKSVKPKKPHKDFPLFAHNNGQWGKKIRQKIHFFGVWANPQKALERWLDEKDDLLAGRVPRCRSGVADVPNIRDLVNRFLTTKMALRDNGELSPYTWKAYHDVCEEIVGTFGRERLLTDLLPEDFVLLRAKWAKKWGMERLSTEINRARIVFNFAFKNCMIDNPIRFGDGFSRPSKKIMRLNKAAKGSQMFEADELLRMINAARQPMKAMLLLGINGGLGNNDIAKMTKTVIDLKGGWLNYPRPKTGIMRRCPLWPETIESLQEWLARRPEPKMEADADLIFITIR